MGAWHGIIKHHVSSNNLFSSQLRLGSTVQFNSCRLRVHWNNSNSDNSCPTNTFLSYGFFTVHHNKLGYSASEGAEIPELTQLRRFHRDRSGIVYQGVIAVSFIFLSSIIWLVGALIVNKTFDAFIPWFAISDPRALIVGQTAVNAYGVSIVVTDVCFLVWWFLSAQKVESVESVGGTY
jgi:hypothetical protein